MIIAEKRQPKRSALKCKMPARVRFVQVHLFQRNSERQCAHMRLSNHGDQKRITGRSPLRRLLNHLYQNCFGFRRIAHLPEERDAMSGMPSWVFKRK